LNFLCCQGYWAFLHVFIGHLDFFFEQTLFHWLAYFFIGSLGLWEFSFLSSLYVLVINPMSDVWLAKIFSHSVGNLFNLFLCRNFLVSCNHICQSFLLVAEELEFYLESYCLGLKVSLYSFIHFELIFVKGMDQVSVFWMQISHFPTTFVEEAIFSLLYVWWMLFNTQVSIDTRIHIWVFCSIGLHIFLPVSCCFCCYGSAV
jgi:hypothetical protein